MLNVKMDRYPFIIVYLAIHAFGSHRHNFSSKAVSHRKKLSGISNYNCLKWKHLIYCYFESVSANVTTKIIDSSYIGGDGTKKSSSTSKTKDGENEYYTVGDILRRQGRSSKKSIVDEQRLEVNEVIGQGNVPWVESETWWRHQMEAFSALLAICAGNSPVPGELPTQRPVTRSFDVFFDLRLNKRLSKQSCGWWFETPSRPLWRHSNENYQIFQYVVYCDSIFKGFQWHQAGIRNSIPQYSEGCN